MLESLFNKVTGLEPCNFIKKRLQHKCFPVNFCEFLRTLMFTEHVRLLLLYLPRYDTSKLELQNTLVLLPLLDKGSKHFIRKLHKQKQSSRERCSVKKVFLEISQNSHENTCARVSF